MLDFGHLPNANNGAETIIFGALGANDWQVWRRPRGKTMLFATAITGGGGGGGGFSGAVATARGGGGGGGSGGIARLEIPLDRLTDLLYCNVGLGGLGGAAGAAGSPASTFSFVCVAPNSLVQNRLIIGSSNVGGGGGAGTAAAAGAAGIAAPVAAISCLGFLSNFLANAGVIGGAGGLQTGAVGAFTVFGNSNLPLSGGAGGAGVGIANTDFAGGPITGGGWFPSIAGGLVAGGRGGDGFFSNVPFGGCGGSGGGSNGAGVGGAGGNGAIGSGGGGGGAGVTGGAGGRGGDGLIIMTCW